MNPLYAALRKKSMDAEPLPIIEIPCVDLGDVSPGDKVIVTMALTIKSLDDSNRARVQIDMISRNGYEDKQDEPIYVKTQESHG